MANAREIVALSSISSRASLRLIGGNIPQVTPQNTHEVSIKRADMPSLCNGGRFRDTKCLLTKSSPIGAKRVLWQRRTSHRLHSTQPEGRNRVFDTVAPVAHAGDALTALTQEQLLDEFCRAICDPPDTARCPARVNPTTTSRP